MKKLILLSALLAGVVVTAKAQSEKSPVAAQQKAQFTATEEAKLMYISKHQEMAANFHRNNFTNAETFLKDVLGMMDTYIGKEQDATKLSKMKELRDKVKAAQADLKNNFADIYSNSKLFITLL